MKPGFRAPLIALPIAVFSALPPPAAIEPPDVLTLLNQTIAWYGHIGSLGENFSPQDALLGDNLHQNASQVVKHAFDFAKTEALLLAKSKSNPQGPPQTSTSTLSQAVSDANDRVAKLQAQIEALEGQIAKAPERSRALLTSQRDTLSADLALDKDFQSSIQSMVSFSAGADTTNSSLAREINALAQSNSVAGALSPTVLQPAHAPSTAALSTPQVFRPESTGILELAEEDISLARGLMRINGVIGESKALVSEINTLKVPLRTALRGALAQGDTLAKAADTETDRSKLDATRKQLQDLAAQFKKQAAVMTPLSQEGIVLQAAIGNLGQLGTSIDEQYDTVFRSLILRFAILGGAVLLILVTSEVVRRSTFRYVRDLRRRGQFNLIRRLVVGFALTVVLSLAFFSGFGSFATVAGFVTAGLAVALQSVILSVVAYFLLIGKYGLRVGDRVTVSGVSGEVIEVGLVRLYLMESTGSGDVHTTGRVAVFPNSIIFQPSALMKQAPGTEYTWHTVTVSLACDSEFEEARNRLTEAVNSVYAGYRQKLEQQHVSLQRLMNIQIAVPQPFSRFHFTDTGCEVLVRFPVEMQDISATDELVIKSILAELNKKPKLQLAPGGGPKIQASV